MARIPSLAEAVAKLTANHNIVRGIGKKIPGVPKMPQSYKTTRGAVRGAMLRALRERNRSGRASP